ncbi:MAG: hypothetical protein AAGG44_05270 [Planctomycetota bacterium]
MANFSLLLRRERFAAALILLAFLSGMVLTAATSGCDAANKMTASSDSTAAESPNENDLQD